VAGLAAMPHVLVTRNTLEVQTVGELIALAKQKPGALTFGSPGNGSGAHLAGELFKTRAAIDILHVPFKGLAPMTTEMLADRIDLGVVPLPGLIAQLIAAGKVRALAVASAHRAAQLPDLPTFAEAGVAGVEADAWAALFAPAKTPPAVIDRLYVAIASALKKERVKAGLAKQGVPIALRTPAEMSAMLPAEVSKWAALIEKAHVTVE
jgi:tripartite-type tricarboxylate transporter receptor subunit TctC